MKKRLLLVASFAFLGGIFFVTLDAAAKEFPEPMVRCTDKEKSTEKCVPGPEERYQFGMGDFCRQDDPQDAKTALSYIKYQKTYGDLTDPKRIAKIDELIDAPKARSPEGLVPCGRSCDDPTTEINEAAECGFCHFFALLSNITNWIIFRMAPTIAILMVVLGGFVLATSRGNPGQSQKGKDILIWTFAGLVVIFVGWMVVNSIFTGLGVSKWTGFTGEKGGIETKISESPVDPTRDEFVMKNLSEDWKDDQFNGFLITITDSTIPELKGKSRTIIDTISPNRLVTRDWGDPSPGGGQEFKIGGWWQFSCGLN